MEDSQTTTELQTKPPEAETESTNLPDDDAESPVGGIRYPTVQITSCSFCYDMVVYLCFVSLADNNKK